ncbi:hypothetical protein ACJX0J_028115, partial [Zea mays]
FIKYNYIGRKIQDVNLQQKMKLIFTTFLTFNYKSKQVYNQWLNIILVYIHFANTIHVREDFGDEVLRKILNRIDINICISSKLEEYSLAQYKNQSNTINLHQWMFGYSL